MYNLEALQDYLLEANEDSHNFIKRECEEKGVEETFRKRLEYIDCTRYTKDGKFRIMQTIGYPYCMEITELVYIVDRMIEQDKKEDYFNQILKRHELNLEFEKTTPPVWYSKKHGNKNSYQKIYENKIKSNRETEVAGVQKAERKSKRETKSQIKQARKAAKIDKLTIQL